MSKEETHQPRYQISESDSSSSQESDSIQIQTIEAQWYIYASIVDRKLNIVTYHHLSTKGKNELIQGSYNHAIIRCRQATMSQSRTRACMMIRGLTNKDVRARFGSSFLGRIYHTLWVNYSAPIRSTKLGGQAWKE